MPDWCTRMFLLVIILGANSPIRGEGDFVTNILDNQGDVGRYCNAAVADDGKLIIAYRSESNDEIRFARIEGTNYNIETVAESIGSGYHCAFGINSMGDYGIAHIGGSELLFSFKATWSDWQRTDIDNVEDAVHSNRRVDLAFAQNDVPHVAYLEGVSEGRIKYATYDRQQNRWVNEVIYDGNGVEPSISVDGTGRVVIAFRNMDTGQIRVAVKEGVGWGFLPSVDGVSVSLALDSTYKPAIAYLNSGRLMYAVHSVVGWQIGEIDDGIAGAIDDQESGPDLSFDRNGRPGVAYVRDSQLMYAHNQIGWQVQVVDDSDIEARYLNLVFDEDNLPMIVFNDNSEGIEGTSLKLAGINLISTCIADFNNDGQVDFLDYSTFSNLWQSHDIYNIADFDGDNIIGISDLYIFDYYWLWTRN